MYITFHISPRARFFFICVERSIQSKSSTYSEIFWRIRNCASYKNHPVQTYSGSQSHTTRRGQASCSLWYAPVANVCDLFLDEKRVIPDFRHFWKVTSPDEELFTVLYFPSDAFPMTWPRKLFTGLNSTGMMVTWLRTLANTPP